MALSLIGHGPDKIYLDMLCGRPDSCAEMALFADGTLFYA